MASDQNPPPQHPAAAVPRDAAVLSAGCHCVIYVGGFSSPRECSSMQGRRMGPELLKWMEH